MTPSTTSGNGALPLIAVAVRRDADVVFARRRARQIAAAVGLERQDQVRFTTAVSELARNAAQYATGGMLRFSVEPEGARTLLVARVQDEGPGITDVDRVLEGRYVSRTGMGLGISGARRLSDRFSLDTSHDGTTVTIAKVIDPSATLLTPADVDRVVASLGDEDGDDPHAELLRQNQELMLALDLLHATRADVDRLTQELAETNRGVVALYAELDDRAVELRRLSEAKSRFLSDVSHELRTPLSSVVNLTRLLLTHADGPLTEEQEKQIRLIEQSATWLSDMVSDLLDIAKIEAGKVTLRPDRVSVGALLSVLRGMLRPLATNERVALVLEETRAPIVLFTDEQRLAQILRNLVSNALKFTMRGEVRVSVSPEPDPAFVRFVVADTGIGIAPADRERIFEDYVQVDGPIQRRVRGTGLGLPLTRKLATLLGGRIELESEVGVGSRFSVIVPCDARPIMEDARDG
jgi:signal transduction histidine kinase